MSETLHSADAAPAEMRTRVYDPRDGWEMPDARLLNGGPRRAAPFPLDCLGSLGPWVADLAASKGAAIDYVAVSLLALAAGVTGAARAMRLRPNWEEPCILWLALVGNPSSGKSPSLATLKRAAAAIEREAAGDMAERRREYEARKVEAEAIRERWEASAKEAVKRNKAAGPMPAEADEPDEPKPPRFMVADATTEKLARIIADNPRGVVSVRDELAGLLGNFGKYGGEDAPFYLSAYSGDFSPVDRVKGGTITAPRAWLSMVGAIPPDKLQGVLSGRANDGLVARFIMVWPDAQPRVWETPTADEGRALTIFRRLRSLEMEPDAAGELTPNVLPLTPDATKIFRAWYLDQARRCDEASGYMAEFLGKSMGGCARVALVLELLEWTASANGPADGPAAVSARSVERACRLFADYFEPMALRCYADAALPEAERKAVALLKEILRRIKGRPNGQRPFVFNARTAQREWGVPGVSDAADTAAAIGVLIECACVREVPRAKDGPGRKPKDYLVNPHLSYREGAA